MKNSIEVTKAPLNNCERCVSLRTLEDELLYPQHGLLYYLCILTSFQFDLDLSQVILTPDTLTDLPNYN